MTRKAAAWFLIVLVMLASVLVLASCKPKQDDGQQSVGTGQEVSGSKENNDDSGSSSKSSKENESGSKDSGQSVKKNGSYDQKEQVAEYLSIYKKLPKNYITKKKAKKLGWQGGSVEKYAPGKAIGGDYYSNYEKKLPREKGRKYYECDIDTLGKKNRGAKRIIYSNDGLIYYTGNHYKSFRKMQQSA